MTKSCGACEFAKPVLFADRTVVCCWVLMRKDRLPTSLAGSREVSMLAEDGADCPVFEAKQPPG